MPRFADSEFDEVAALEAAVLVLQSAGYITTAGITLAAVVAALGLTPGTNAVGTRYVSTSAASGGVNGDIWYQV